MHGAFGWSIWGGPAKNNCLWPYEEYRGIEGNSV